MARKVQQSPEWTQTKGVFIVKQVSLIALRETLHGRHDIPLMKKTLSLQALNTVADVQQVHTAFGISCHRNSTTH